jgi:DivIVA domain-containing protein
MTTTTSTTRTTTTTSEELRNVTFREVLRGYQRTEVDDFCARAADTIDRLEDQVRALQERLDGGPMDAASGNASIPVVDGETIQRTLILAQRVADEAIAEAQDRAHTVASESEAKAHVLVADAESTARRISEEGRRRVETEIEQLGATRDSLRADVDTLERFTAEFRDRLRGAVQRELARLEESSTIDVEPPPRPDLQTTSR